MCGLDYDVTYWLDIRLLQKHREAGNKSIKYFADWIDFTQDTKEMWTHILGKKRRVLFDYDFIPFFEEMNADGNY